MGLIGGESRHYTGGGLGHAAWKCPACGAEQVGPPEDGCPACGAGRARAFKAPPAPPPVVVLAAADVESTPLVQLAQAWAAAHPESPLHVGFIAGYLHAQREAHAQTMAAPPVTADVAALAPEGKVRRTIVAALELFRDQVLTSAKEEIASGEWCSPQEVHELIAHFREGT